MNFNLTTDPWIPVRWIDGYSSQISLNELFAKASEIADLSAPPHERISLMRLLVCITQAALGAPATPYDWPEWGYNLEAATRDYLSKWKDHLNLMGEGSRFLQAPINDDKDYPTAQMVFHFSTGNTPTLLDHIGDDDRILAPAFIARTLLVYQNHFVGGSLASKVKGNGPALKALHSFLTGGNLRESILFNCIDLETLYPGKLGKPVWEGGTKSDYLARLVPTPCKLWLTDLGNRVRIDQGTIHEEFEASAIREPSTTIITGKRAGAETDVLLRANIGKGIWRDLHLIAVLRQGGLTGGLRAPMTFRSHLQELGDQPAITFWAGELIKAKDAKILDAMESVFTVPLEIFSNSGQQRYQDGVTFAENLSKRLYGAVKTYFSTLKQDASPTDAAQRHFWNTLDQKSAILLELLKGVASEEDPMGAANFGEGKDPWTLAVRAAANAAYGATCPRQTSRQYEAYAAGIRVLRPLPKKTTAKKTARTPTPATTES